MGVLALVRAAGSGPAQETAEHLRTLGAGDVRIVEEDELAGAGAAASGDVLVVRAGARLAAGALERLAEAAGDPVVATAAAIALDGAHDAAAVAERSLHLRPRTPRATLDCAWVNRSALELAGPLDDSFGERCSALGLLHVVADDVLAAGVPATDSTDPLDAEYLDGPPRP
ncbi:MAG TPA: hypothetical protein VGM91_19735, partial [Conexibacter sp.]